MDQFLFHQHVLFDALLSSSVALVTFPVLSRIAEALALKDDKSKLSVVEDTKSPALLSTTNPIFERLLFKTDPIFEASIPDTTFAALLFTIDPILVTLPCTEF
jgi:hypothetical protein